jgi:hypothetical protein
MLIFILYDPHGNMGRHGITNIPGKAACEAAAQSLKPHVTWNCEPGPRLPKCTMEGGTTWVLVSGGILNVQNYPTQEACEFIGHALRDPWTCLHKARPTCDAAVS